MLINQMDFININRVKITLKGLVMIIPRIKTKEERNKYKNKINVLRKVKDYTLLNDGESMTLEMVSEYYEADKVDIGKIVSGYRNELTEDGMEFLKGKGLNAYKLTYLKENKKYEGIQSLAIMPLEAVLKIGMLLENSIIANQIRNALIGENNFPIVRFIRDKAGLRIDWYKELEDFVFCYTDKGIKECKSLKQLHKELASLLLIEPNLISNRWYNPTKEGAPLRDRLDKDTLVAVSKGEHLRKNHDMEQRVKKLEDEIYTLKSFIREKLVDHDILVLRREELKEQITGVKRSISNHPESQHDKWAL
ncbi:MULTISPECIES: hypothetical protein [Bacillus amyloliquefaciens group]|uniref:hypothetical protein n=1 Tax=Bacillus amyloliquefaciens group TaxID=1938374 RepID=UPI0021501F21|nr:MULTISPECIES: hypothetical protein [Bacillus amyloliquefaciens group]MCR4367100.1 hypothetical protein [Bacillus amyloliquefaciens]MCV3200116.1 hypothetical protein [Bacillus velezensis]